MKFNSVTFGNCDQSLFFFLHLCVFFMLLIYWPGKPIREWSMFLWVVIINPYFLENIIQGICLLAPLGASSLSDCLSSEPCFPLGVLLPSRQEPFEALLQALLRDLARPQVQGVCDTRIACFLISLPCSAHLPLSQLPSLAPVIPCRQTSPLVPRPSTHRLSDLCPEASLFHLSHVADPLMLRFSGLWSKLLSSKLEELLIPCSQNPSPTSSLPIRNNFPIIVM